MSNDSFEVLENVLFLKKNHMFHTMNTRELKAVAAICNNHTFRPNEKIVTQGDVGETMFLIKSGKVTVTTENELGTVQLASLSKGDNFGEMSMFDTEVRSATVTAVEECSVLSINGADLTDLLRAYPEIGIAVIKTFVQRIRLSNTRLQEMSQE